MDEFVARAPIEQDLVQFMIASALLVVGLVMTIGALARRERVVTWAWFGGFALVLAALNLAEVHAIRVMLITLEKLTWSRVHSVATILLPVGMLGFVNGLFAGESSRAVRWLLRGVLIFFVLSVLLEVIGLVPLETTRSWSYAFTFATIIVVVQLTARARKRVVGARTVLIGIVLLAVISFPDMLWGMGMQVLPFNTAPVGELLFLLTLGLALVEKAQAQTRALEDTNLELQHQVEARSRELRLSLSSAPHALAESGEHKPGAIIGGRYRVVRRVGSGAMGVVYEATRDTDGRRVAIKSMRGQPTREDAARFAREAELAARLSSPHLVPVLDVGLSDGAMFLAMAFIEGPTLKDVAARFGEVPFARRVLRDVARGLVVIHASGVGHRDLKPANVLLEGDGAALVARIADFGVARALEHPVEGEKDPNDTVTRRRASSLTGTGNAVGTPRYMAPEQVRGAAVLASDVFAFGMMALEVLGRPVPDEDLPWVRQEKGMPPVMPVVTLDESALSRVLQQCLSLDPSERPSATALVTALE